MLFINERDSFWYILTKQEELVSIGDVVERVAENNPGHAEHTNAVETRDLATVVGAKQRNRVGVHGAVLKEFDNFGRALTYHDLSGHHVLAHNLLFGLDHVRILTHDWTFGEVNDALDNVEYRAEAHEADQYR